MTDSSRFEEAKKWVDSLQDRWRLQVLTKKFRVDPKTGVQTELPVRIRRFVEGMPWALVQDAIDYLLSQAPYSGIIFNGVPLEGTYRPTITTWKRDDQDETVSKTSDRRTDGTYTLVQDLIDDHSSEKISVGSSASCSEEVVTEWHWDESAIGSLPPDAGEQGVSYAIQAVSRNEDGTFDYALVCRRAKTQHAGRHVTVDDATSHVEVDSWNNLYGNSVDGFCDELGNPIQVPHPEFEEGTKLELRTSENDDCTFRVEATWTSVKKVESKRVTEKDQFREQQSVTTFGATDPLPDAPEPADGVVKRHENQLNPDGSMTTVESKDVEVPVSESVVEVMVGRKGVRRTVTDRNQEVPADTSSVDLGGSVRVEKTPGKRFNNTVSTWIRSAFLKVADVCKIDLFSHRHSKTEAGLSEIPKDDDHVKDSGKGGVVKTRTTQMDEDGSITKIDETETEQKVLKARESWVYGLFGRRHRVENQHVAGPIVPPQPSRSAVGKTITNERTPGGLYNTIEEEIDRTASPVEVGSGCERTVFEHTDTESERRPDGSDPGHVDEAGGGVHRRRTVELNDDGSSTVRTSVTEERPVEGAEVIYRRTAKAVFRRVTDRNVKTAAVPPLAAGETQSHVTNPGGTRNVTKETIELTGGVDRGHCRRDIFSHEHDNVSVTKGVTADTTDTPAPGDGKSYSKESTVSDDGLVTTTLRETKENTVSDAQVSFERKPRGLVKTVLTKSGTTPARDPGVNNIGSQRHVKTPGGRFDLEVREVTPSTEPDSARCQTTVFEHVHDQVTMSKGVVDKSDAPMAGGGRYYEKTSELDSDGLVKTVVRTHEEKPSVPSGAGRSSDAFQNSVTTVTRGNPNPDNNVVASTGLVITSRSTRQPGGTWEIERTESRAKPAVKWDAQVTTSGMFKVATMGFSNMSPSSFYHEISSMLSKAQSWARETYGGLVSSSARVSHSSSMNKYGLLDGVVTATVEWPTTAGLSATLVNFRYDLVHENVTPMYDTTTNANGDVVLRVRTQVAKITRQCRFVAGFGVGNLSSLFSGTAYEGTRFSYNSFTGAWSGTIVEREERKFDYSGETRTITV